MSRRIHIIAEPEDEVHPGLRGVFCRSVVLSAARGTEAGWATIDSVHTYVAANSSYHICQECMEHPDYILHLLASVGE